MAFLSKNDLQISEFHSTKKHIAALAILFVIQKFLHIDIEGQLPFIGVNIPSKESTLILFAVMSFYFLIRFCIDWLQLDNDTRQQRAFKLDFLFGLLLSTLPIFVTLYDITRDTFVWQMPIMGSLILLAIGEFIAVTTTMQIIHIKYIRSKDEALKKGLPRVPVAVRATLYYIPINFFIILAIWAIAKYFFTEPLSLYWAYLLLLPFLIHLAIAIYDFIYISPERISSMMRNFDQHDTNYQIGGWDKIAEHQGSAICKVAYSGDIEIFKRLLEDGGNPNIVDCLGWSPLLLGVAEGHEKILDLCLEYGANVNQSNTLGRTALMFASRYGYIDMVKKLLLHGATVNIIDHNRSLTPLMAAVLSGHKDVVELLLEHDADVLYKNLDGETALEIAETTKNGEIAKILRKKINTN